MLVRTVRAASAQMTYGLRVPNASDAIGYRPNGISQLTRRTVVSALPWRTFSSTACDVISARPVRRSIPQSVQISTPGDIVRAQAGQLIAGKWIAAGGGAGRAAEAIRCVTWPGACRVGGGGGGSS